MQVKDTLFWFFNASIELQDHNRLRSPSIFLLGGPQIYISTLWMTCRNGHYLLSTVQLEQFCNQQQNRVFIKKWDDRQIIPLLYLTPFIFDRICFERTTNRFITLIVCNYCRALVIYTTIIYLLGLLLCMHVYQYIILFWTILSQDIS